MSAAFDIWLDVDNEHVGYRCDTTAVGKVLDKLEFIVRKGLTRNAQRRLHQRMMRN